MLSGVYGFNDGGVFSQCREHCEEDLEAGEDGRWQTAFAG
jgi:hypothetical protein